MPETLQSDTLAQLDQAIANLRRDLSGPVLEAALSPLLQERAQLQTQLAANGTIGEQNDVTHASAGGHMLVGKNNSVATIINQYLARTPDVPNRQVLEQQIGSYLKWMLDRHSTIELRGIQREGFQVVQLDLKNIYVPLVAQAYGQTDHDIIKLDCILNLGPRCVITGGPGSGKTTVLLHLAWTLSQAIYHDQPELVQEKLGLSHELPLPIFVPLSTYALYLRHLPHHVPAAQKTLAAFISHYLIQQQTSFDLPPDFFQQLLLDGRHIMLLLDGLDEVPNEAERTQVRQAIENLVTSREAMRVIITCRSAAYRGRTALGKGFKQVQVTPLDQPLIELLVRRSYDDIYRHDASVARNKADDLLRAIERLEAIRRQRFGKRTQPLVSSPLLVRMLLIVHYSERRLPDQRAELYMKATDAMLLPEYAPDEQVAEWLGSLIGGSREVHRELVQHLAYQMHHLGESQGREITESQLRQILRPYLNDADLIDDFISLTRLRGTLLEERLGMYRFIHLAFQEYLTARYLAEVIRSDAGLEGMATFLEDDVILDSWWREPALLVVGYLSVTSPQIAQRFLRRLAGIDVAGQRRQQHLMPETQLAAAELAGTAALEWPNMQVTLARDLADRLATLIETPGLGRQVPATLRHAAGDTLARLGDPRAKALDLQHMELCYVPPGLFWMGSPDQDDMAFAEEKPLHQADIPYGYWLARHPISIAQFQRYVNARPQQSTAQPGIDGLPNQPMRHVTWDEALEFCRWLTDIWHAEGIIPATWVVILPSEAEWEKAARGGLSIPGEPLIQAVDDLVMRPPEPTLRPNPQPLRRYPWGDTPDPERANYDDTSLNTPSAAGIFPGGESYYGCQDMSGNVWEWTRSTWGKGPVARYGYPYNPRDGRENGRGDAQLWRVLRGGAFGYSAREIRCSYRGRANPDFRFFHFGFRIAVVPRYVFGRKQRP